jgi:hypothetical protein
MTLRIYIRAALFACRYGSHKQAVHMCRMALVEANRTKAMACAGHLMAALNKGRMP